MPLKTVCLSHSPLIGILSPDEKVETAVHAQFAKLAAEVEAYKPDLIILIAPDHFNGFFYDLMPSFCVGVRAEAIGDYDTASGPLSTHEELALKLFDALGESGFDPAVSYKMQVDHAFSQPLSTLTGSLGRYPVVPIFINAAAPPRPAMKRVRKFGEAVGRFALATGLKVLIVGSGGLSHDPPVPSINSPQAEVQDAVISGRNPSVEARAERQQRTIQTGRDFASGKSHLRDLNDEWDRAFLALLQAGDVSKADTYDDDDITANPGRAGHEVRTWVASFAAQSVAGRYKTNVLYQGAVHHWIVGWPWPPPRQPERIADITHAARDPAGPRPSARSLTGTTQ